MNNELINKLAYAFHDQHLLTLALTHRSKSGAHNERLEFLGDAIVNFVIADILFHQFPTATEGELSRWRASLVNRDTLAELAKRFELGKYLHLGPGELRSGGHARQSILSCTMEAVIGAVYLDGGFSMVRERIEAWYLPWLQSLSGIAQHKDPKTLLQEYLQSHKLSLPVYSINKIEGEAHQQHFVISCEVVSQEMRTEGWGTSRRRAEQAAAEKMLQILKQRKS